MLKLTSRTGTARGSQKAVFQYLSDFRNFSSLLPSEKMRDLEITEDSIRFIIDGFGTIGLIIREKHPFSQLVIGAIEGTAADFTFFIDMAIQTAETAQVNITLNANLNMFIEMMAKGPLQQFLDLMIDKLETVEFGKEQAG